MDANLNVAPIIMRRPITVGIARDTAHAGFPIRDFNPWLQVPYAKPRPLVKIAQRLGDGDRRPEPLRAPPPPCRRVAVLVPPILPPIATGAA